MNITSKHTASALVASLSLLAVAASNANASYSGLADGNPGPADVWAATHPEFGKVMHSHKAAPGDCAGLREAAIETGSARMWHPLSYMRVSVSIFLPEVSGADGGTRTHTTLPSQDFKSCVSTGSTTSAPVGLMAS